MQKDQFGRIFGIPVWHSSGTLPEGTMEWAQEFREKNPVSSQRSNRGGYQQDIPKEEFPRKFVDHLIERTHSLPPYLITNLWLNINKKGDYNVTHCHGGSDLSFVWYLTDAGTKEDKGHLVFRDPHAFGNAKLDRYLEFKGDTVQWEMKAGDFLAFPSYLEHRVEPHTSEEDRVSIAGNCWVNDNPEDFDLTEII